MRKDLLDWQWRNYPDNHTRRLTLVVHVLSVPLFAIGGLCIATSPLFAWSGACAPRVGWEMAVVGLSFVVATVASQGWAHMMEPTRPIPFDGPADFVSRFVVEQLVTFPRFLFSGKLSSTWRRNG